MYEGESEGSKAVSSTREPAIRREISELDNRLEGLKGDIGELISRIAPILGAGTPTAIEDTIPEKPKECSLAIEIENCTKRVIEMSDEVKATCRRIEL